METFIKCEKCGQVKPVSEFVQRQSGGFQPYCKDCLKEQNILKGKKGISVDGIKRMQAMLCEIYEYCKKNNITDLDTISLLKMYQKYKVTAFAKSIISDLPTLEYKPTYEYALQVRKRVNERAYESAKSSTKQRTRQTNKLVIGIEEKQEKKQTILSRFQEWRKQRIMRQIENLQSKIK